MLNTININLKTDIKTDRPTSLPITLMSQDKNNNRFILRFTNGSETIALDDTYTVEVLTKFATSGTSRLTTAKVRQGYATWDFDTAYITQDETVYNYVYVRKSGSLIASADTNCFVFNVRLSEIDKGTGKVAEIYDHNYEKALHAFEEHVNLTKEEWTQMAGETRGFVDEIKDKTADEFVELKMGEELANLEVNYATRLTELESSDQSLTSQLEQTDNEIVQARGDKSTLGQRLDETDVQLDQATSQLGQVDNEIVQARGGNTDLGQRLDGTTTQLAQIANNVNNYDTTKKAFEAMKSATDSKTLHFPNGDYVIAEPITIEGLNDVKITMDKGAKFIIDKDFVSNGVGITFKNCSNLSFENIKVDFNRNSLTDSRVKSLFGFEDSEAIEITDGISYNGVVLYNSYMVSRLSIFNNCKHIEISDYHTQKSDLASFFDSKFITIRNCELGTDKNSNAKNTINPIYTSGSEQIKIINNKSYGASIHDGTGASHNTGGLYYASDCSYIEVVNNEMNKQSEHAMYLIKCENIIIRGNSVLGDNAEFKLRSCRDFTIQNNEFSTETGDILRALTFSRYYTLDPTEYECENGLIENNVVRGAGFASFDFGGINLTFKNNKHYMTGAIDTQFLNFRRSGTNSRGDTGVYQNIRIIGNEIIADVDKLARDQIIYMYDEVLESLEITGNSFTVARPNFKYNLTNNGLFYIHNYKPQYTIKDNLVTGVSRGEVGLLTDGIIEPITYTVNKGVVIDPVSGDPVSDSVTSLTNIKGKIMFGGELYTLDNLNIDLSSGVDAPSGQLSTHLIMQYGGGLAVSYSTRPQDFRILKLNTKNSSGYYSIVDSVDETFDPPLSTVAIQSPNGTRYQITVDDNGTLTTALV